MADRSGDTRLWGGGATARAMSPSAQNPSAPPDDAVVMTRLRELLRDVGRLRQGTREVRARFEAGVEAQANRTTVAAARLRDAKGILERAHRTLARTPRSFEEVHTQLRAVENGLLGIAEVRGDRAGELPLASAAANAAEVSALREQVAALETAAREQALAKMQALDAAGEVSARLVEAEAALARGRKEEEPRLAELERAVTAGRAREVAFQRTIDDLRQALERQKAVADAARVTVETESRARQALEIELAKMRARAIELQKKLQLETQHYMGQAAKSAERAQAGERDRTRLQDEMGQLREESAQLREELAQALGAKEGLARELRNVQRLLQAEQNKNELTRLHAKLEEIAWAHPAAVRARAEGANGAAAREASDSAPDAEAAQAATTTPIVAIGASTGGPEALAEILPLLPAGFPACLLIVQHMPPGYTAELAAHLNQKAAIEVVEARHGDLVRAGTAFVAPGGHHMEVQGGAIRLVGGPPVNNVRPSVDVLFDSLVASARRVQAVLLTGMGADGAVGMTRLRAAGAETIVQDQSSSVVWGMPGAAVKAGAAVLQMPPAKLGNYLVRRITSRRSGESERKDTCPPVEQQAAM